MSVPLPGPRPAPRPAPGWEQDLERLLAGAELAEPEDWQLMRGQRYLDQGARITPLLGDRSAMALLKHRYLRVDPVTLRLEPAERWAQAQEYLRLRLPSTAPGGNPNDVRTLYRLGDRVAFLHMSKNVKHRSCPGRPTVATDASLGPMQRLDGTGSGERAVGLGMVDCVGRFSVFQYPVTPQEYRAPYAPNLAELRALGLGLRSRATLGSPRLILTDNLAAVYRVRRWQRGDLGIPVWARASEGALKTVAWVNPMHLWRLAEKFAHPQAQVEVRWVAGHRGHLLNEGADAVARLMRTTRLPDRFPEYRHTPRGRQKKLVEKLTGLAVDFARAYDHADCGE